MADELETLLDLYGRKAGVYVLHNGIRVRVWYEGEELKTLEIGDQDEPAPPINAT